MQMFFMISRIHSEKKKKSGCGYQKHIYIQESQAQKSSQLTQNLKVVSRETGARISQQLAFLSANRG